MAWSEGFVDKGWVAKIDMGATWSNHYLAALYWSSYTLTTVGYGDVSMVGTAAERAFGTPIV